MNFPNIIFFSSQKYSNENYSAMSFWPFEMGYKYYIFSFNEILIRCKRSVSNNIDINICVFIKYIYFH